MKYIYVFQYARIFHKGMHKTTIFVRRVEINVRLKGYLFEIRKQEKNMREIHDFMQ